MIRGSPVDGAGLYADGHVAWTDHPFNGQPRKPGGRDNFYTRHLGPDAPAGAERFMGSPIDKQDAVLMPTAAGANKQVRSKAPANERAENPGGDAPKAADGL